MKAAKAEDRYQFGPFVIDAEDRILLCDGKPVPLAARSFDLLHVLVNHAGRVVEKDELLRMVWPDAVVEENSVAKAVAEIRKALGESPKDNRYIVTVARRGYRFVAPESRMSAATGDAMNVAVLPFRWLSQEDADSSLGVGLADALITRLSNLPQLVVRPTTSILKYAGGEWDHAQVANELAVHYVISGSLQLSGDRVRVTVQMVSPGQQRSIWADRFDERFSDSFAVEDAISGRVAAALALQLTTDQRQSLARPSTRSNTAWQLYLRGRFFLSKRTLADSQKAIAFFRQAIDADPGYAQAWVGIAATYIMAGLYGALTGWLTPREAYPQARAAAEAAIALNDTLSEAHAALGFVSYFYDWDSAASERAFTRSLQLNEHSAVTHHWYAMACIFDGRAAAAIAAMERALEIDPLSPLLNANKGYILYLARQSAESLTQLQATVELNPAFAAAHHRLGLTYASMGLWNAAIRRFEEAQRLSDDSPQVIGALGWVQARAGNAAEARGLLARLLEMRDRCYVSAASLAEVCLGLESYEEMYGYLEEALVERTSGMVGLRVDPRYDCVRADARFQELLARVKAG